MSAFVVDLDRARKKRNRKKRGVKSAHPELSANLTTEARQALFEAVKAEARRSPGAETEDRVGP